MGDTVGEGSMGDMVARYKPVEIGDLDIHPIE